MHNIVEIEGDKTLARDISSHAVITVSPDKLNDYQARKRIAEQKASELALQQEEIEELKDDIKQIKSMLQALLQR
jgi:glucan phosphorylase